MEQINSKSINRIFSFSLFVFSISIIFVVLKYMGIISLFNKIANSLVPVFIAIFISFILEPLVGMFLKFGIKRKYSVLLVYGLLIMFLSVFLYFIIPSLIKQVDVFISNAPNLLEIVNDFSNKIGFSVNKNEFDGVANSFLISGLRKIGGYISSSFSFLFNIILGISGAIFLSFDFPEFRNGVKKYIPKRIKRLTIYYFQNFLPVVHKYFLGMIIDSLLIFFISVIGFSVIGIEYNLVLSLFVSITNLVPVIGPYIGGVPAVIVGFASSASLGISALIVVAIVQIIESNFIQPLILKNVIKLHPVEGIFGISLFGALFGIVGMILSPILVVSIKLLFLPYDEIDKVQFTNSEINS